MSTNYETLNVIKDTAGISLIEINRPDKLNALNELVLEELKRHFLSMDLESGDRGVIITGSGEKAFIAGADIKAMSSMSADEAEAFGRLGQELTLIIESSDFPVIAAVNGYALGGGCELALSADMILCSSNAIFGLPELSLGLIPGFGGTQRLAKNIGTQLAKQMIFSGRKLNAKEACAHGLVLEEFPSRDELLEGARKILGKTLSMAPLALKEAKHAINGGVDLPTEDGLEVELSGFRNVFETQDFKIGVNAFLNKEKAKFEGK